MRKRRLMNQINVVPYIDVMLVLLVIFMVTAPMINPGVVDLPKVGQSLKQKIKPIIISIKKNATTEIKGKKYKRDELLAYLKVTTKKPKSSLGPGESVPRPTDLFGGTPETATLGPLSAQYQAHDIDGKKTKVKAQASQVVDALVEEYSTEIVRRLKDELTTLLDELDTGQGDSKKE